MEISLYPLGESESDQLIELLVDNTWPFLAYSRPGRARVKEWVAGGMFTGPLVATFWIVLDEVARAGIVRLYGMNEQFVTLEIRLSDRYRGQGIGRVAIQMLTNHVFTSMPEKIRMEGFTRQDNLAMRRVFRHCGYVMEAHFRKAMVDQQGNYFDIVGYGITREDWASHRVTPVQWEDEANLPGPLLPPGSGSA